MLVVAVLARVAWIVLVPNRQWSDVACYDDAARGLAGRWTLDFGPACHHYRDWFPPGWPLFLAPFYRVFGPEHDVFKWMNVALALFVVYGTIAIGTRVFDRRMGLVGGLLMALLPGQIAYVGLAQYEVFLTALVVAMLWLLVATDWPAAPHTGRAMLLGAVLAWGVLTRPPLVLLPAVLFWYFARTGGVRRAVAPTAVVAGCVLLAVGAWTLRNQRVLGERVLFSTNGGYNLWHGNHAGATGGAMTPPRNTKDPHLNPEIIPDERANNRQAYGYAMEYIKANPGRFVRMIPRRIWHLFNTDTTGIYLGFLYTPLDGPTPLERFRHGSTLPEALAFRTYALSMLLALCALGLVPWRNPQVQLLGVFVLYWIAGVAITFGQDRYRVPIMPIFGLFAAYTVVWLTSARRRSGTSPS